MRINELAPVGFTWVENGVPERSVTPGPYSTVNFYSGYTDKQVGGGIVKVIIGDYSKLDLKVTRANGKCQQFGYLLGIFNI
ncbi:hypothetical protein ACVV55_14080 [Enterococcus faecalis]